MVKKENALKPLISSAGATRIITIDFHADQIQGFFEVPVDHLFGSTVFIKHIESLKLKNLTIASPDIGGSKRANAYAKILKSGVVICYKERKQAFSPGGIIAKKYAFNRKAIVQVGKWIFVHGGLSVDLVKKYTIGEINEVVTKWMCKNNNETDDKNKD